MPLLVVVGCGMMVQMASSNTVLQTICDDDKRGRVMSFYTMAFMGTVPLGQLLAGHVARLISLPSMLLLSGLLCLVGAAAFASRLSAFRRQVAPIYQRFGWTPPPTFPTFPAVPAASGTAGPAGEPAAVGNNREDVYIPQR